MFIDYFIAALEKPPLQLRFLPVGGWLARSFLFLEITDSGGQRSTLISNFTPRSPEVHVLVVVLSVSDSRFSASLSSLSISGATLELPVSAMPGGSTVLARLWPTSVFASAGPPRNAHVRLCVCLLFRNYSQCFSLPIIPKIIPEKSAQAWGGVLSKLLRVYPISCDLPTMCWLACHMASHKIKGCLCRVT